MVCSHLLVNSSSSAQRRENSSSKAGSRSVINDELSVSESSTSSKIKVKRTTALDRVSIIDAAKEVSEHAKKNNKVWPLPDMFFVRQDPSFDLDMKTDLDPELFLSRTCAVWDPLFMFSKDPTLGRFGSCACPKHRFHDDVIRQTWTKGKGVVGVQTTYPLIGIKYLCKVCLADQREQKRRNVTVTSTATFTS